MTVLRLLTLFLCGLGTAVAAASPNVEIVVNGPLYSGGEITLSINRYMADLRLQGYNPILTTDTFESAESLRAHLSNRYSSEGLVGAVFVGDIPVAKFENSEDGSTVLFPLDLYYTDLDGTWWDLNGNGQLDFHLALTTGVDVTPEIYLGRLTVSSLLSVDRSRTEAQLLNAYFDRNHAYRIGELTLPANAMMYLDDDWSTFGKAWSNDMRASVSGTVDVISNTATTTAKNYVQKISAATSPGYESMFLAAHSNAVLHEFYTGGSIDGRVYSSDLEEIDPEAFFFHLFACWSGDYQKQKYIAGEYVFGSQYGLLAMATTKKGGILVENGDAYYDAVGEGETYGDAFRLWMEEAGMFGYDSFDRYWNYGLTLIGDPLLTAQHYITPSIPGDLNGDGIVGSFDLNIVRAHWGEIVTPGDFSFGDVSYDGLVNSVDLDFVRTNWGRGLAVAAAAVPEPAFLPSLLAAILCGIGLRRRD